MSRTTEKQKILRIQSQMSILFIPFLSFLMMTATAQVLKMKVKKKRGIANQRYILSGI